MPETRVNRLMIPNAVGHRLIFVTLLTGVCLAAFITTPTSINATLGSTATFNCSATTGAVGWLVNGSLLTELNTPDITISSIGRIFFLHVPAREEYNNTFVRCVVVIRGGNALYSDPVILKVQGLLDAVSNLTVEFLGQVIHLTWDAPFSLDVTGVDPDIWYRVDITVDNTPLNIYNDINITEFNFTVEDDSLMYKFQVTPINGAGNGTVSNLVTGYFRGRNMTIIVTLLTSLVTGSMTIIVTLLTSLVTVMCCVRTKWKAHNASHPAKSMWSMQPKAKRKKKEEGDDLSSAT